MDRQQLLAQIDRAWTELTDSYAGLSASQMTDALVTSTSSAKDLIAHVTWWEEEALEHLPLVAQGGRRPRYSVTYGGIDAFNALRAEERRGWSLVEVLAQAADVHARLLAYLETVPEELFATDTRFRRRLRLDTYGHYRIHARADPGVACEGLVSLRMEAQPQRAQNLHDRREFGIALGRQGLVQALPAEARRARNLSHTASPCDVTKRGREERGVIRFKRRFQVGDHVILGLQVVRRIPALGARSTHGKSPSQTACKPLGAHDIRRLGRLVSADEQDNHGWAAHRVVHTIARTCVDSHLGHTVADRSSIAGVPNG